MLRALLIPTLAIAALAPAGTAAADDCVCFSVAASGGTRGRSVAAELESLVARELVSRELVPEELLAPGFLTHGLIERFAESLEVGPPYSSDGAMLISELRRASQGLDAPTPAAPREVLWCWGPDDPRCEPATPGPDDGPRAMRPGHSVCALPEGLTSRLRPRIVLLTPRPRWTQDTPSDGVSRRVDRPPRS